MSALLGTSIPVFIAITVVIVGFAAYMAGQALGNTWKPLWHLIGYDILLGCADRFLIFSLFDGELLSATGYLIDTAVLFAISFFAYRINRVNRMVSQYPWLYERSGMFGWRSKG